jgi:hypothetical protein
MCAVAFTPPWLPSIESPVGKRPPLFNSLEHTCLPRLRNGKHLIPMAKISFALIAFKNGPWPARQMRTGRAKP